MESTTFCCRNAGTPAARLPRPATSGWPLQRLASPTRGAGQSAGGQGPKAAPPRAREQASRGCPRVAQRGMAAGAARARPSAQGPPRAPGPQAPEPQALRPQRPSAQRGRGRARARARGLSWALLGRLAGAARAPTGAGLVAEPRCPLKSRRCFFSSGRGRHY